jgi:uncharacterized protein YjbI with pentapeptide repeats
MTGIDLHGANLQRARLDGARLEKADLGGANLEGATFGQTHFEGANLSNANWIDGRKMPARHGGRSMLIALTDTNSSCRRPHCIGR